MFKFLSRNLDELKESWLSQWERALEVWSRFTKLSEPVWCLTAEDEKREGLQDTFAMIRLVGHVVVIGLRQIKKQELEPFAVEIMAHEIGHHVYAPADLADNARLIARIRMGLPTREVMSGMIANLYTDLLINDRLQRSAGLDIAGVYRKMKVEGGAGRLWNMYMRIYEILWRLPAGDLVSGQIDDQIQGDAALGARLIRAYAKDWLDGAGRFAALCLPYVIEETKGSQKVFMIGGWSDTLQAGAGGELPDGLTEIEDGEEEGAIHPALDEALTGLGVPDEGEENQPGSAAAGGRAKKGGQKSIKHRDPNQYVELMKSLGVDLPEDELIIRYYKERARPHLIRFPSRIIPESADPLPEGLDLWEPGLPLADVDWMETVIRSPQVIPGVTTVQRTYGTTAGAAPEKQPVDLFLGVDCSGSMMNPKFGLSYPVLAGTVIVLSALRAGARVKVTLSGEPGEHSSTDGFIRREKDIMKVLTGYLGTGYAFGILRLRDTFLKGDPPKRPTHILIVTDSDIFHMLKEVKNGWEIARQALIKAGGGGTYVLNMQPYDYFSEQIQRMKDDGWNVHFVSDWSELVAFARAFSKENYERQAREAAGSIRRGRG